MKLPDTTTLLIIDVQQGMVDPTRGPRSNPEAESRLERVLSTWRNLGRPLIHVKHNSIRPESVFHSSSPGNEIQPFARPLDGEVLIEKQANCAFVGTDLEARLRADGVDTVVIMGFVTNHCVETTARIAGDLGFDTYVVSDATGAYDRVSPDGEMISGDVIHQVALTSIHGEFATVVTSTDVIAAISQDAGN